MKNSHISVLLVLLILLMSGCMSSGLGRFATYGNGDVAENPMRSPLGGRYSITHSMDTIHVVNSYPEGYFVNFYEGSEEIFCGMFSTTAHTFWPDTCYRNNPVVFRSIVYTLRGTEQVVVSTTTKIIYINRMNGPVTVLWEISPNRVNVQEQVMYSSY